MASVFFLNSMAYGIGASLRSQLRAPIGKGIERAGALLPDDGASQLAFAKRLMVEAMKLLLADDISSLYEARSNVWRAITIYRTVSAKSGSNSQPYAVSIKSLPAANSVLEQIDRKIANTNLARLLRTKDTKEAISLAANLMDGSEEGNAILLLLSAFIKGDASHKVINLNLPTQHSEDITQDIILRLPRIAELFKGKATFKTYLYRVIRNRCLNTRRDIDREERRNRRLFADNGAYGNNGFADRNHTPAALISMLTQEQMDRLERAIARDNNSIRKKALTEWLNLFKQDGKEYGSYLKIEQQFGLKPNTMKKWVHRLKIEARLIKSQKPQLAANVQRTPDGLNKHFKILANVDLEGIIKRDFKKDPNKEGIWVMFGDMSAIRLLNTVYSPEIIDILIPMAIRVVERALGKYGGKASRIGIKGDEIWVLLPSKYSKEQVDNIRREVQERVAKSITGMYWGCKVMLLQNGKTVDPVSLEYDAKDLFNQIQGISYAVLGKEDLVPGFYKAMDGIFMYFKGPDKLLLADPESYKENLHSLMDENIKKLNRRLKDRDVTVVIDKGIEPFGLLSPMVFFGATQKGEDVKASMERAERILNVEKGHGEEGGTDSMLDPEHKKYVDLEERTLNPLTEEEQGDTIGIMAGNEEVSGVKVTANMLDRTYTAIGERHLRALAEPWLEPGLAQAMVRHTNQSAVVGLLDIRYILKGRLLTALEKKFPTREDKITKLRGQVDDIFGLTVAFKYFNDGLTGEIVQELGLPSEGHTMGNKVLKAEAKAILKEVIAKLERQNILLFRGPPDNWWFLFLGPLAQDFDQSPEKIERFVDDIAKAVNGALAGLGLEDVEVKLRMNLVSSTAYGKGVASIISTAKDLAKCRDSNSFSNPDKDKATTKSGNVVKIYNPQKRPAFLEELSLITEQRRKQGIGFLTDKRIDIINRRGKTGPLSANDIDTMRVMHISGWLKGEDLDIHKRLAYNATLTGNPKDFPKELPNSGHLRISINGNAPIGDNEDMANEITERFERIFNKPELYYIKDLAFKLSFIGQEMLANAIRHGRGVIDIYYSFTKEMAELKVINAPQEDFDPENLPDPLKEENLLKTSGRGIFIIKDFLEGYKSASFKMEFVNDKVVATLKVPLDSSATLASNHEAKPIEVLENGAIRSAL